VIAGYQAPCIRPRLISIHTKYGTATSSYPPVAVPDFLPSPCLTLKGRECLQDVFQVKRVDFQQIECAKCGEKFQAMNNF
jgi:hypothetical protein